MNVDRCADLLKDVMMRWEKEMRLERNGDKMVGWGLSGYGVRGR